jgi:hypothetical protein
MRKIAFVAGGAALLLAIYATVYFIADAQLMKLLPKAVAEAVGGQEADRYAVRVGSVRLSPMLTGVAVEDLSVSVDTTGAETATEPALVRDASLRSVSVSGLRLLPLLSGKGLVISTIDIEGPSVVLDFAVVEAAASEPIEEETAADMGAAAPTGSSLTATLQRVRIRDGSVDLTRVTDRGVLTSFVHGLDLELTEIRIDSVSFANPVRALTNSRVVVWFDSTRHVFDDSLYAVTARQVRADSRDSLVEIGNIALTPTLEASPFFARLSQRADRLNLSAGPLRVEGLDFSGYVSEESLHVRLIDVDSLDLHVYSDIKLDWGPRARPCRYHMGFADIAFPLRVDSLRVNDAFIRYSELAKGSQRPGDLTLEGVDGVVRNLTNDPERMTRETPAVADLTAKLFGQGDLTARVEYPLLSPTLNFRIQAALGPMSLPVVNQFATNVTGVEVTKGRLDRLQVNTDVRGGRATGLVRMEYRDLDFRLLDRNTGKEMAWHAVGGFLGNLVLRSNNPGKPGGTPRDGRIDYTCGENDIAFFELFIHALTNGLKRIVI